METGEDDTMAQHVFLERGSRATRGKRMTKLLDDEAEEDELFWNQEALKDEEVDVEYEAEGEVADVFDSDFDEDEPDADQEGENNEPDERRRTRKRLIYPGKPSTKKKKIKVLPKVGLTPTNEKTAEHSTPDDVEAEKIVRKSTRTSVVVRQAERDAIRAAIQATMKPIIKKKKEGEEKRMSQEEMLLEAAQTEIMNLRNLEKVLAREEEVKKRAIVHKAVYSGPQIRFLSRNGYSYLDFINGSSFDSELSTTSPSYPEKAVCPVTGLPAIYRDPKTGLPYATKEAFKIIRERHEKESNCRKTDNTAPLLSDLTYEQGFSQKRKRSLISQNREASYSQNFARFRRFPELEDLDSD